MNATIECPICGVDMDEYLVVCWRCYRRTDRLTPGSLMPGGRVLDAVTIAGFDAAREARLAAAGMPSRLLPGRTPPAG